MKSPAFRFYPSDFLTSTDEMSSAEVGLYIRLLSYQWIRSEGGLPNDPEKLIRLTRWEKPELPVSVMSKFRVCEDGLLRNPRMEAEKTKQVTYREGQAEFAKKRWVPNGSPMGTHELPIPETTKQYEKARPILAYLNEKAGLHYREVDSNLRPIAARLLEPEVTADGVRLMIDRMVKKWKGTEQSDYLRPETLFGKQKFDGYYASRGEPVISNNGQPAPPKRLGHIP